MYVLVNLKNLTHIDLQKNWKNSKSYNLSSCSFNRLGVLFKINKLNYYLNNLIISVILFFAISILVLSIKRDLLILKVSKFTNLLSFKVFLRSFINNFLSLSEKTIKLEYSFKFSLIFSDSNWSLHKKTFETLYFLWSLEIKFVISFFSKLELKKGITL